MAQLHLFNAYSALLENKSAAEKVLREKGIDPNNEDYVNLKTILAENQNIGYLGLFVTLIYNGGATYDSIYVLYDEIKEMKAHINELPKPLLSYTNLRELQTDMETVRRDALLRKYIKKNIFSRDLKQALLTYVQNRQAATGLATDIQTLEGMGSAIMAKFLQKSKRYSTVEQFNKGIKNFIATLKAGHTFDEVTSKINEVQDDLKIVYSDRSRNVIIMRVLSYRASALLGSPSWCISYSPQHWRSYTIGNSQYFIFNFTLPATNPLSCIGVTMDGQSKDPSRIREAQDRFDSPINKGSKSLKKMLDLGNIAFVMEEIKKISERERVQGVLPKSDTLDGVVDYPYHMNGKGIEYYRGNKRQQVEHSGLVYYATNSAAYNVDFNEMEKIISTGNNLDTLLNLYQHYRTCVRPNDWKQILQPDAYEEGPEEYVDYYNEEPRYDYEYDHNYTMGRVNRHCDLLMQTEHGGTFVEELNLMPSIFQQLHDMYKVGYRYASMTKDKYTPDVPHERRDPDWEFSQETLDEYISTLRKLYTKHYNKFLPATRNAILAILRQYGDDTVATTIKTKQSKGADLTEYEFNNGVLRGMKMQPLIQKKIKQLEQGDENVDFNAGEMRFAINNGYKKLFYDHYSKLLDYGDITIDYDDAQILQLLGLADKAGEVLAQRVQDGGGDMLNSIEHSIYDIYRRKQQRG